MNLAWEPLATPKRGYEREFADLFKKLMTAKGSRVEQLMQWLSDVSEPPFTTLGAPRVGVDAEADVWLVERVAKSNRTAELAQIQKDMEGYNVLELMPPCDGFPVYSEHKTVEALDRYSFNAGLVVELGDALGPEMLERCYTSMLVEDHADFASKLTDIATKYWLDNTLSDHVATIREPVFPEGSQDRSGHILYAAAKWCTYWSQRGHGLAVTPY
jgi:hypothetical protein